MTRQEFSDSFDTLLNSYASQAQFGDEAAKSEIVLDEYEKSVLLTQAQDIIIKSFFDRKQNNVGEGFDDSTRRQVDFSSLIVTASLSAAGSQNSAFDDRGIIYKMPLRKYPVEVPAQGEEGEEGYVSAHTEWQEKDGTTDVLFILNEKLETTIGNIKKSYVVVPINYREYDREMTKAYAQPLKKQAWRLFQNSTQGFDIQSELIPRWNLTDNETISKYKVRYIRRPCPIVLVDLPNELEIDGFTKAQDCELNPILHPEILQKALEIAISTRGGAASVSRNNKESVQS